MTIELQTAKFFPGYFEENAVATPPLSDSPSDTQQSKVTAEEEVSAQTQSEPKAVTYNSNARWTTAMMVVTVLLGVMGLYGVTSGLWEILSISSLETARATIEQMPASPESQFAKLFIDQQLEMQLFLYACAAFRAMIGFGFVVGAMKMFRRSTAANEFVATVCTGAIIYHIATAALTWLTLPSIQQMGLGLDDQANQVANGVMIGMLIAGACINSIIHVAIIVYMYRENNKNYFAS